MGEGEGGLIHFHGAGIPKMIHSRGKPQRPPPTQGLPLPLPRARRRFWVPVLVSSTFLQIPGLQEQLPHPLAPAQGLPCPFFTLLEGVHCRDAAKTGE
jgi:hypothetical protein